MSRYVRAQHRILQYIAENSLNPGDRLPSERELSQLCGVSLLTLRRSLGELRKNDLIESRHGLGSFVRMKLAPSSEIGQILFLSLGETWPINDYRFFATFKQIAGKAGFTVEYCKPETDKPQSDFLKNLKDFSGVIVYGHMLESWLNVIRGASCPVVLVPNREANFGLPAVNLDIAQGTRLVIREQLRRDVRSFLFLSNPVPNTWGYAAYAAALDELKIYGIPDTGVKMLNLVEDGPDFYRKLHHQLLPYRKDRMAIMVQNHKIYIALLNILLEDPEITGLQIGFCSQIPSTELLQGAALKRSVIAAHPPEEPWKTAFHLLWKGEPALFHKIPFSLITQTHESGEAK